jgi:DNA mismatch repair protein MutS
VALTPMMQQYLQVKENYKDCILFFRLGDFYEMFFEDAETASKELELVLTGRDCGLEERAPMCGIPYHSSGSYIGRLVSRGYKVAICEQMEDPSVAKGIVKRDVIKVITPGTFTDSFFIEETKNNFIMSIYLNNDSEKVGMSFADISTGELYLTCSNYEAGIVLDEISKFSPKEILIQESCDENLIKLVKERFNILFTRKSEGFFKDNSKENLAEQFTELSFDIENTAAASSCNGLLNYVRETQKLNLTNINKIEYYSVVDYLTIDINSRKNLELTETLRDKTKKGSLLWVLDKTCTSMGARELKRWVEQPLINKNKIEERLSAVEELTRNMGLLDELREALKNIYDIERIVGKVSSKSVNAKELLSLKASLKNLPKVKEIASNFKSKLLDTMGSSIDELKDIHELIETSIAENPSLSVKDGGIIKDGYNSNIDELKNAKAHGKEWIANLESSERTVTNIKSLKVGYNKIFGYYIEISNANKGLIPEGRYIRKQTLANAERYITPELKEMEDKILGAEEKLNSLEYEIFVNVREEIESHIGRMKATASLVSKLDCLSALALTALENNYSKPVITDSGVIKIEEGRHPVVEKVIPHGSFVANNTNLDVEEELLLLITGPNMAGKSTYMRQVALIVIMAQIGSFVPAKAASIAICDKIFTRIGASDDLASGKSTFMVEMWEVSNILKNATNRSLVLLDEVGRGTSTYDGLSIAWSVIEYICSHQDIKCKTLFATHYHELTKLEGVIKGVKNYSVSVKEVKNDIIFLRKIVRGGADQSYGIEVAKLAGIPQEVINRAKEILGTLEKDSSKELSVNTFSSKQKSSTSSLKEAAVTKVEKPAQISFMDLEMDNLIKEIKNIDILNLTPIQSFSKLYELINKAKSL